MYAFEIMTHQQSMSMESYVILFKEFFNFWHPSFNCLIYYMLQTSFPKPKDIYWFWQGCGDKECNPWTWCWDCNIRWWAFSWVRFPTKWLLCLKICFLFKLVFINDTILFLQHLLFPVFSLFFCFFVLFTTMNLPCQDSCQWKFQFLTIF